MQTKYSNPTHCVAACPRLHGLEVRGALVVQEIQAVLAHHPHAAPVGAVHEHNATRDGVNGHAGVAEGARDARVLRIISECLVTYERCMDEPGHARSCRRCVWDTHGLLLKGAMTEGVVSRVHG